LNLGVDFAFSTDDQAVYIRVGEKYSLFPLEILF
jgi:hypothetical protein